MAGATMRSGRQASIDTMAGHRGRHEGGDAEEQHVGMRGEEIGECVGHVPDGLKTARGPS
ncbi:hypothetical protein WT55_33190 [Burkholderia pseudomultivorans]|nr:hypothetical protein WT55_33190 [Burkholderia pseudomultivorans]